MNDLPLAKLAPSDPELTSVMLKAPGAGRVFYSAENLEGERGTVVCLHGLPGSVRDFRYLAPYLVAQGFGVVRIDLPGFGQTPQHVWPLHDMKSRASFVCAFVKAVGIKNPILLGHSFGGGLALLAAHFLGADAAGVVLVNSIGINRHKGLTVPEHTASALRLILKTGVASDFLVEKYHALYKSFGFKDRDLNDQHGRFDKERVMLFCEIVGGLDFHALRGALRSIRCTTLVFSAKNDPLVQPSIAQNVFANLHKSARGVHVQVQKGGHFLQKHHAKEIAEMCGSFRFI